jgi:hypothetical protein
LCRGLAEAWWAEELAEELLAEAWWAEELAEDWLQD